MFPRIRREIDMLAQLDIPCFETRTDTSDLSLSSCETLRAYFVEPCVQAVKRNFQQFDETDRECQVRLIRNVFDFKAAVEGHYHEEEIQHFRLSESARLRESHGLFKETAVKLAELLKTMAIRTATGAAVWMIPEEILTADELVYQFRQSDWFLYQGSAGLALFLAAMETLRPHAGYGELTYAALLPLSDWLKHPWIPGNIGIGGVNGLGSLVYTVVKIGHLLDEPLFIEQACQIGALITSERIAADTRLDVFDGAAGTILGLLALYAATHDQEVLDRAVLCGEHLLSCRTETMPRAWRTIRTTQVSGLSHGVAGIVYALLRLFAATDNESFRQAVIEGLAFERNLFSADAGNWRAFASSAEQPEFWTTYCHGAPGIGLARLGGLDALDTPDIRADIAAALTTTANFPSDGVDFLCCGNFGRIETLLTASRRLPQPDLLALARRQAAALIARQTAAGGFRVFEDLPPRVINPGFFRGIAGIGYELLRLTSPERFPSVLLWE
jgi:type 2 lantibiotic biosynthesis protein LanM